MNRREVLSAIVAGSAVSLAGCSSDSGDDEETTPVELLSVGVLNWTEEVNTVQVRVELDGENVEEVAYELEPGETAALDCTWPSDPGAFVVAARVATDDDWTESDMTALDADCVWPTIIVRPPTNISIPTSTDCDATGRPC